MRRGTMEKHEAGDVAGGGSHEGVHGQDHLEGTLAALPEAADWSTGSHPTGEPAQAYAIGDDGRS